MLLIFCRLLTQSLDILQAELDESAKKYDDRIESYEKEVAEKDARISDLEEKLRVANETISLLESQLGELKSKLKVEQIVSANLSRKFESEIESLKSKLTTGGSTTQEMTSVKSDQNDYLTVLEMEGALRRSKQAEVSLINQNMKIKQKLKDLQQNAGERATANSVAMNSEDGSEKSAKRRLRSKVIQFVKDTWKKVFRRKNN